MCASSQALQSTPDAQKSAETDEPTYSISTWDHEREGWDIRHPAITKWEIRRCLRQLYSENWDHVSILVERND